MFWITLLAYVIAVSLVDWHTSRVPNWATLPVLFAGILAHFPGNASTLLASFILVIAFAKDWMGAGDVKLWLALVWAMPISLSGKILPCMLLTLFITGLGQILWRWLRKKPLTGISSPAAWRTIPFILALWHVH